MGSVVYFDILMMEVQFRPMPFHFLLQTPQVLRLFVRKRLELVRKFFLQILFPHYTSYKNHKNTTKMCMIDEEIQKIIGEMWGTIQKCK